MANLALVLLLAFSCQALAEDVPEEQEVQGVTLRNDFKAMLFMQKEDLELVNSRSIARTQYSGPYDNVWLDDQCAFLDGFPDLSVAGCLSKCEETDGCTAVNHRGD